jgi:predicted permease
VLARWFSGGLVAFLNTDTSNQFFVDLTPGWRIFGFMSLLAGFSCVLFGLTPALRATLANPGETMKQGGRGMSDRHGGVSIRRALVILQVALSLVLVVGGVLLGRTLRNLVTVDPGFRQEGVLIASLDLRRVGGGPERLGALIQQMVDRVNAVPGVRSATQSFMTPVSGLVWNGGVVVEGKVQGASSFNTVGPGFFKTLGTPVVAGREFETHDNLAAGPVTIINEAFAHKFFPNGRALGRTFQLEVPPGESSQAYQVVGIVKNAKYTDLREQFGPIAYFAATQDTGPGPFIQIVVSSNAPLAGIATAVTQALSEVDPNILLHYQTLESQVSDTLVTERLMATLSGFFGGLAALIAAIGLYGVMSYMVARRRVEIGIRMALGADRSKVFALVLREAGLLLGAGIAAGAVLAGYAARLAQTLLYGLTPWDPITFASGAALLGIVSLLASWLPARRAAHLPPTMALREE